MISDLTEIVTNQGYLLPSEFDDETQIICPRAGVAKNVAIVRSTDFRTGYRYTLAPRQNTSNTVLYSLVLPRPSFVSLEDITGLTNTYDLRVGDKLPTTHYDVGYHAPSFVKGFMWHQGITRPENFSPHSYPQYQQAIETACARDHIVGFDTLPFNQPAAHKASFIRGYLCADGWPKKLSTTLESFVSFFEENASLAGLIITGERGERLKTVSNKVFVVYSVSYAKGTDTRHFRVVDGPSELHVPQTFYSVQIANGGSYTCKGGWTLPSD